MLRLVTNFEADQDKEDLHKYYKLRKRLFIDKMGWDIQAIGDWEVDGYDALNPAYLFCQTQEGGELLGGLRLMPTTGRNMLNDTFPALLPEGKRIEDPLTWESSRFAIDSELDFKVGPKNVSFAVAELSIGLSLIGRQMQLDRIVTVYDAFLHRVLKRWGIAGKEIGGPVRFGRVEAYAVSFDLSQGIEERVYEITGIPPVELKGSLSLSRTCPRWR